MVSFICNACGQTVKKNQVEKHFQSNCPNCEVLSCIDCGKDFYGGDYSTHTSCITEAEKYQGKLYKPKDKQNKGEQKQQEWIKHVKEASGSEASPKIRGLLEKISDYSNVPRKQKKFQNFCQNSLRIRDDATLQQLWEIFSENMKGGEKTETDNDVKMITDSKDKEISSEVPETDRAEESEEKRKPSKKKKQEQAGISESNKDEDRKGKKRKQKHLDENGSNKHQKKTKKRKRKEDQAAEEDEECEEKTAKNSVVREEANGHGEVNDSETVTDVVQGTFSWKTTIKKVLKGAPDHELPLKKLRKKVLAEFLARGGDNKHRTENELRALFEKKVTKNPLFKVHKERVQLCK